MALRENVPTPPTSTLKDVRWNRYNVLRAPLPQVGLSLDLVGDKRMRNRIMETPFAQCASELLKSGSWMGLQSAGALPQRAWADRSRVQRSLGLTQVVVSSCDTTCQYGRRWTETAVGCRRQDAADRKKRKEKEEPPTHLLLGMLRLKLPLICSAGSLIKLPSSNEWLHPALPCLCGRKDWTAAVPEGTRQSYMYVAHVGTCAQVFQSWVRGIPCRYQRAPRHVMSGNLPNPAQPGANPFDYKRLFVKPLLQTRRQRTKLVKERSEAWKMRVPWVTHYTVVQLAARRPQPRAG
ncbi:hypothetical protein Bbelb_368080 [Branchiostoma belcheri]|nr:hypothetical protein Bbelb_368080 [Branchiostoma belcheri]